jgi:hypothetical protein
MDQVGYLSIVGRIKDMIIRGGENTYPRAPRAGRGQAPRPAAVGRAARAGRRPRASSSSTSRAAASPRAARSRGGDRTPAARPEASRRRARWRAGLRLPGRARRTAASPATRRPGRPALALDERMVDPQRAAAGRAEFVDRTRLRSQPARRPQAAACVEPPAVARESSRTRTAWRNIRSLNTSSCCSRAMRSARALSSLPAALSGPSRSSASQR